jgi:hypothetical protein
MMARQARAGHWTFRTPHGRQLVLSVDYRETRAADAYVERRTRLNQRLRQAFIEGAKENSSHGWVGLTAEALESILRR